LAAQQGGTPLAQLAFETAVTDAAAEGDALVGDLRTAVAEEEHDISQGGDATSSAGFKTFVKSDPFSGMTLGAARDALTAAVVTAADPRRDDDDVLEAASSAALAAAGTTTAFRFAHRASLNHVPFDSGGSFQEGGSLSVEIFLGQNHPTNPFRHRRHPDHASGFEILRKIQLAVDTVPGAATFEPGGYGTDRLSGRYEEELFGLHKKLGADRSRGLITAGRFTVYRISTNGTLNP
jgi:hypothetical protein